MFLVFFGYFRFMVARHIGSRDSVSAATVRRQILQLSRIAAQSWLRSRLH